MKQIIVALVLIGSLFSVPLHAQDTLKNKKDGHYYFTVVKNLEANAVQNQNKTGTCWSFSALSFMESELIRLKKGKHKLSEMFVVRMAYMDKAEMYIRMHGISNLSQGGAFHDIPYVIEKYGIMPEEAYKGLNYGEEKHNHSELEAVLKGMCDAIIKRPQGKLTTAWRSAVNGVLDAYLGKVPETFTYQGANYTAKSFAEFLGLKMTDYVVITSFTHHPFYSKYTFDVPDNWSFGQAYNLPMDEMVASIDGALMNGYSVAWAADVSEKGFSFSNGLAIVPENEEDLKVKGSDNKHFNDGGAERTGNQFDTPGNEKVITQKMRQEAYDNYLTTDDHGMHFTGLVKDQNGKTYYVVKNSWGTENGCGGYMYASVPYVQYKTMNVMVHKSALSKAICKKLDIQN